MCGKVRWLGGKVATGEKVAQGGRRPNVDRVSGGDEASGGGGRRKQNEEKRGKEGFLKLRHLRCTGQRVKGECLRARSRCQVAVRPY